MKISFNITTTIQALTLYGLIISAFGIGLYTERQKWGDSLVFPVVLIVIGELMEIAAFVLAII